MCDVMVHVVHKPMYFSTYIDIENITKVCSDWEHVVLPIIYKLLGETKRTGKKTRHGVDLKGQLQ